MNYKGEGMALSSTENSGQYYTSADLSIMEIEYNYPYMERVDHSLKRVNGKHKLSFYDHLYEMRQVFSFGSEEECLDLLRIYDGKRQMRLLLLGKKNETVITGEMGSVDSFRWVTSPDDRA